VRTRRKLATYARLLRPRRGALCLFVPARPRFTRRLMPTSGISAAIRASPAGQTGSGWVGGGAPELLQLGRLLLVGVQFCLSAAASLPPRPCAGSTGLSFPSCTAWSRGLPVRPSARAVGYRPAAQSGDALDFQLASLRPCSLGRTGCSHTSSSLTRLDLPPPQKTPLWRLRRDKWISSFLDRKHT